MIVIKVFKENAEVMAGFTSAVTFEECKKRLKLYFPDLKEIKGKIKNGKVIDIPYLTLQKDRRIDEKKIISKDRRRK